MRTPSFLRGVTLAFALSAAASLITFALLPFVSIAAVARLLVPVLAGAYLIWLLSGTPRPAGRMTVLALWSAMALAAWLFVSGFVPYLLLHAGAIWLIRSVYWSAGPLAALADLALSALAAAFALATLQRTGSVFLATWGFFLAQALIVAVSRGARRTLAPQPSRPASTFDASRQRAEAALRQMFGE